MLKQNYKKVALATTAIVGATIGFGAPAQSQILVGPIDPTSGSPGGNCTTGCTPPVIIPPVEDPADPGNTNNNNNNNENNNNNNNQNNNSNTNNNANNNNNSNENNNSNSNHNANNNANENNNNATGGTGVGVGVGIGQGGNATGGNATGGQGGQGGNSNATGGQGGTSNATGGTSNATGGYSGGNTLSNGGNTLAGGNNTTTTTIGPVGSTSAATGGSVGNLTTGASTSTSGATGGSVGNLSTGASTSNSGGNTLSNGSSSTSNGGSSSANNAGVSSTGNSVSIVNKQVRQNPGTSAYVGVRNQGQVQLSTPFGSVAVATRWQGQEAMDAGVGMFRSAGASDTCFQEYSKLRISMSLMASGNKAAKEAFVNASLPPYKEYCAAETAGQTPYTPPPLAAAPAPVAPMEQAGMVGGGYVQSAPKPPKM